MVFIHNRYGMCKHTTFVNIIRYMIYPQIDKIICKIYKILICSGILSSKHKNVLLIIKEERFCAWSLGYKLGSKVDFPEPGFPNKPFEASSSNVFATFQNKTVGSKLSAIYFFFSCLLFYFFFVYYLSLTYTP